jgi:hypothetical protein
VQQRREVVLGPLADGPQQPGDLGRRQEEAVPEVGRLRLSQAAPGQDGGNLAGGPERGQLDLLLDRRQSRRR